MIKSITLQGFKSFADRIHIEFETGICAVIGPNGSGKSNVVEAIRWVTHGARARELRAGKSSELIFHGSGGKAPLGFAEVQLELHTPNTSSVATNATTLSLSRRIYRDGSAEQDIGGKNARVRDVQAALRGTGLGTGGLAVIGQGEVSNVVQAEGATLLGYLQEAAGLSRAVGTRKDTERRLKEANNYLNQLELVYEERQQILDRLKREAQTAVEERQLYARQLLLEESLTREKSLQLDRELLKSKKQIDELEEQSQLHAQLVQQTARALEVAREQVATAQAQAEAFAAERETLRVARDTYQQTLRYRDHLLSEAQALEQERNNLPREAPTQPLPDLELLGQQLEKTRLVAEKHETAAQSLDKRISQGRQSAAQHSAQLAGESAKKNTLSDELEQLSARLKAYDAQAAELQQTLEQAEKAWHDAKKQHEGWQHKQQDRQMQQRQLEQELGQLAATLAPLEREKARLEKALNNYSRYSEGARNALQLDHVGIVGSVADLLEVPAEYETAMTAALGRRLEHVVVHTADDAKEIIAELKRLGGRATFLPLDLLRARSRRDFALLGQAGVLGNMADLCPTEPPLVAENLLADTLLVTDLEVANHLARQHRQRPRLVTLGGELLEASGAMTGGRLHNTGSAVLGDQRRFHELCDEMDGLKHKASELQDRLDALAATSSTSVTSSDATHVDIDTAELNRREQVYLQKKAEWEKLEARLQAARFDHKRLQTSLEQLSQAPQVAAPLPEYTAEHLERLEQELSGHRQQAEQSRATERDQLEALALARELATAWKQYHQASQRDQELKQRQEANALARSEQERHLETAAAEVKRREASLGTWNEQEYAQAEQHRETVSREYSNIIARQNKIRANLEELRLKLARKEGSRMPIPDGCVPAGEPKAWQSELGRIRKRREALGPINARAEADYQAALDEWGEQQRELEDARAASQELGGHLEELELAETLATQQSFERVNAAFREYSAELLGGQGYLETETRAHDRTHHAQNKQHAQQKDAQTDLFSGLRLVVQPKGKRTRSMNLLSAGERTMAGLAFLFSLNHAQAQASDDSTDSNSTGSGDGGGLPLAVLDEVDAPLDEANIRRFTAFLTRFAQKGTQFVLVTHQKATMEVAHALWGVTTDQTGASRILSIKQQNEH